MNGDIETFESTGDQTILWREMRSKKKGAAFGENYQPPARNVASRRMDRNPPGMGTAIPCTQWGARNQWKS